MFKRIRINTYQVGLVYERDKLVSVLKEGVYYLFGNKRVAVYDTNQMTFPALDLNVVLQHEDFVPLVQVVEVADTEIALQFVNANFKGVLTAGRYAFWRGLNTVTFTKVDLAKVYITEQIPLVLLEHPALRSYVRRYVVLNFEKGLLFVNGVFAKELAPGSLIQNRH